MDLDEILEYPNDIASCYKKCKRSCPWREFEENKWYFLTKIIVEDIHGPNYFLFNDSNNSFYILSEQVLHKYFIL